MNELTPFRREAVSNRKMLVGAIVSIGLAASVAVEAGRHTGKLADTFLLFPGFTADAVPSSGSGLVVTSLRTGSEAQQAGIAVGDEVLAIDNHPVRSLDEAEQIMGGSRHGQLALRLLHNNRPRELILDASGVNLHEP